MISFNLYKNFSDSTNLKTFLRSMHGSIRRSYISLSDVTKEDINHSVELFYCLENVSRETFLENLHSHKSWTELLIELNNFISSSILNENISN